MKIYKIFHLNNVKKPILFVANGIIFVSSDTTMTIITDINAISPAPHKKAVETINPHRLVCERSLIAPIPSQPLIKPKAPIKANTIGEKTNKLPKGKQHADLPSSEARNSVSV